MKTDLNHTIHNYVTKNNVAVFSNISFQEAIKRMVKLQVNVLVIVNKFKKIKGIISVHDIIEHIIPDYLEDDKHLAAFEAENVFEKRILKVKNDKIKDIITKKVYTVQEDAALIEAVTLISEHHVDQLPVVNKNEEFIGLISQKKLKEAIVDILKVS
ncbi:MAG: HPP family protein [Candidatus Zixiibacteriota bacterium]